MRMFSVTVAGALLFPSVALAECPWAGEEISSVYVSMTTVSVNSHTFMVKGRHARDQFVSTLVACDADPLAVSAFTQWRGMRRATNWTAGVGICLFWPALLATPVTAVMAGQHRDDLQYALARRQ